MITQPKTPKSIRVITMPDFLQRNLGVLQSFVWNYEKGKTFSVYQIAYGTLYGYRKSSGLV